MPDVPSRSGGLAAWSVHHPIGVVMMALAIVVLGVFAFFRLGIDLLPHIIYPEIRVRILDPGVPAKIMEDEVTRQLEEQLAITEDAISVQSRTSEGRSSVDLSFAYGKDIDVALRDASTRLDRAKRFLPETIDPPIIFKRDPSQIPVAEFVVTSPLRDPVELRSWVDYTFAKSFLNLPGVAAAEVAGGVVREVQILPDQQRLAGLGLTVDDLVEALEEGNVEEAGGRLRMARGELTGRTTGRFTSVDEIARLPLSSKAMADQGRVIRLHEVARIVDGHEEERLRIRANGIPGIKMSIQKQPQANTVAVVETVRERLSWLREQGLIPEDVQVATVDDQSVYVRHALHNAAWAAVSGAVLAMAVVYIFLGSLRRTLIIGSVLPIAMMVTFALMNMGNLTLNIMTLGGLALGVGLLVDNTIVMLENIYRHQRMGARPREAAVSAAREVNSAVVAATSTNLAAVLPFLFIGGLVGLLFRELIFTISAAIIASLVVALTLVPALGAKVSVSDKGLLRRPVDRVMDSLQDAYAALVRLMLRAPWLPPMFFIISLGLALPAFQSGQQTFVPRMDEGRIWVSVTADPGVNLDEMDRNVRLVEELVAAQPEVNVMFTTVGGFVFGRSQFESSNRANISVQLAPAAQRGISSDQWIERMEGLVADKTLAGIKVRMWSRGIRGIRLSRGDHDISLRVQGPDLETLANIGDTLTEQLEDIAGLSNVRHSLEEILQEISVTVDRERATDLGLSVEEVGRALRIALDGIVVTDFIDGDRKFDVRLRLPRGEIRSPRDLESILLTAVGDELMPVHLGDVASVRLEPSAMTIHRDRQQRIIEISGNIGSERSLGEISQDIRTRVDGLAMPAGYTIYDGGSTASLQQGQRTGRVLLALAIFLVLVVMAVQYESLRNPLVILFSVPFAAIGVALGLETLDMALSMPVWLGLIMLAGIVVNNAIVLVEYIELSRQRGMPQAAAIEQAGRLRLRPILMTTLTTVAGMLPLAMAWGDGAEMLQPLATTIVTGLSFSLLVTLVLVPCVYAMVHRVPSSDLTAAKRLASR